MVQTTIFDRPRARHSDPITSQQSASEIRHRLNRLHQIVAQAARASEDGLTSNEIAEIAYKRAGTGASRETLRKRCREACVLGLLVEGPARKCSVSGKSCATFKATN